LISDIVIYSANSNGLLIILTTTAVFLAAALTVSSAKPQAG
jgi:hypothetical protein